MTKNESDIVIKEFDEVSDYAANYLRTFFMEDPVADDQALMRFIAREYATLKKKVKFLEIGCGPVVNHILSAVPYVSEIHMADFREDNLTEVRKWVRNEAGAHNWNRFTRFALTAEGLKATDALVKERETKAQQMIKDIRRCDLRNEYPFGSKIQYPAVACFYTTEQASRNREEWPQVFTNLTNLVEPGGSLFCCAVGFTDHYILYDGKGGSQRYPVPKLTPEDFTSALAKNGFDMTNSTVSYHPLEGQENEGVYGVILVSALKNPS